MKTVISVLILGSATAIALPAGVQEIDSWISEVNGMVDEWELLERTVTYTHPTIPAIGMPHNTVTGWFDQIYGDDEEEPWEFDEVPYFIENIYQHAGHGALEEYYYMPDGEMVCCVSMVTVYNDGEEIHTNTFYFDEGELIYVITETGEISANFSEEILLRARNRFDQGELFYELFMSPLVPVPCIFWEEW